MFENNFQLSGMLRNFSSFSFFNFQSSRFRFRSSIHDCGTSQPAPVETPEPEQVIAPVEETATDTPDKIEISQQPEDAPVKSDPTYSFDQNAPVATDASDEDDTTVPVEIDGEETDPVEEQPAESPVNNLLKSRFHNRVKLNMEFDLAHFETVLSQIVEQSEEGEGDGTTSQSLAFTNMNIGLHIDMNARAKLVEKYALNGESTDPKVSEKAFMRSRGSTAMRAMAASRNFRAETFYRQSFKSKFASHTRFSENYMHVTKKLAMKYSEDFSFKFSSLEMFQSQSEQLAETENLGEYLAHTEALTDMPTPAGELVGKFFEAVQSYFDGAEDRVIDKINAYFDQLDAQFGGSELVASQRESLIEQAESFFDNLDSSLQPLRNRYLPEPPAPAPEPEFPEPPPGDTETPEMVDFQPEPVELVA